jgi:hypothetical protein
MRRDYTNMLALVTTEALNFWRSFQEEDTHRVINKANRPPSSELDTQAQQTPSSKTKKYQ